MRKFNADEAFLNFERSHLSLQRFPQYYDDIDRSMELFEQGHCYPLIDRDEEGRKVIFVQTGRTDADKYSVIDSLRLTIHVTMILLEEEETQVSGISFIYDNSNISPKHIITPVEARDLMTIAKSCSPMRLKQLFITNLPSYANVIVELLKPFLSDKLKQRLQVLKDNEELKSKFDVNLLPKHLGGKYTEDEMKANFMKLREKYLGIYKNIWNAKVDMDKVDWEKIWMNKDFEVVGSFRKLDID